MKKYRYSLLAALLAAALGLQAQAKTVPEHEVPVPSTVSEPFEKVVAAPDAVFAPVPDDYAGWKKWQTERDARRSAHTPGFARSVGVKIDYSSLGGVKIITFTPEKGVPAKNQDKTLIFLHGGGFTFNYGLADVDEAIGFAAYGGYKIINIDYRMPPDYPFPAALADTVAVYRELIKTEKPENIGIFGSSAGGGLTLSAVLRFKDEGLPLPGAIAPGSPWSDLTKTGDSYYANVGLDNVLKGYEGWLEEAAKLYADGRDLKDPYLSPIYGDLSGFPPTLLISGTRDLFLSNTVRVHRKLRDAGVFADLLVFEGMSHVQYYDEPQSKEYQDYFKELDSFFQKYLN